MTLLQPTTSTTTTVLRSEGVNKATSSSCNLVFITLIVIATPASTWKYKFFFLLFLSQWCIFLQISTCVPLNWFLQWWCVMVFFAVHILRVSLRILRRNFFTALLFHYCDGFGSQTKWIYFLVIFFFSYPCFLSLIIYYCPFLSFHSFLP